MVLEEDNFCIDCGQALPRQHALLKFMGNNNIYKFKDGMRCASCARIHVDKARRSK